ncbi:hypothetical protein C1646_327062 [Rhizophagus diaphanus]|nr:hypothetical protein C1646_327062 [Rhizophagus diaphanus] [Rhizophagus sp. MUCL 43196]
MRKCIITNTNKEGKNKKIHYIICVPFNTSCILARRRKCQIQPSRYLNARERLHDYESTIFINHFF